MSVLSYLMYWYIGSLLLSLIVLSVIARLRRPRQPTLAFFHPYCNDGGGGERVLWCAIRAALEQPEFHLRWKIVVYSGDIEVDGASILRRVKDRFGIELAVEDVQFVFLEHRWLVDAKTYPVFTMLGQSIGGLLLGCEALIRLTPHVFIDSMGYSFTFWLFRLFGGSRVGCYVHYPTISTDMLGRVENATTDAEMHNNRRVIQSSRSLSRLKVVYYRLFALLYGIMGAGAQVVIANSTWTRNHIASLWHPAQLDVVYPPCNTTHLLVNSIDTEREPIIISIAQFRPEKDHPLQIRAFARALKNRLIPEQYAATCSLVLIGSCRNAEDQARVEQLQELARSLGVQDQVSFQLNLPLQELQDWTRRAMVGLHTMWCEHFGIGVVELMAAGVITIAHRSGGPKADIIIGFEGRDTGFLAETEEEYAQCIGDVFSKTATERQQLQRDARASVEHRFSDEEFASRIWARMLRPLLSL